MSEPLSNVHPLVTDLVSDFMALTEGDTTPAIFRRWSGISLIAGALERRVWALVGRQAGEPRYTYPNLYVFLVAAPAVGKFIINSVRTLWAETREPGMGTKPAFCISPNNMTKASLIDALAEAKRTRLLASGPPFEYHSLLVAAEEFGVFLPMYDGVFIGVLNDIYNCSNLPYTEKRRTSFPKEITIPFPCLNILGGVQPGWLASVFPEEAWSMGLTSRTIMIYGTTSGPQDPFAEGGHSASDRHRLLVNLGRLSQLYGEVPWHPEARRAITDWHMAGGPPTPTHSKLTHYNGRRTLHTIKLALVSAVSRTHRLGPIEPLDVTRAIEWICEAERLMPDIFRAMIGKNDHQIMEELYTHLMGLFAMNKQKPVHGSHLKLFLAKNVPSDKVDRIMAVMEGSGMIARLAGTDNFIPRARHEFGVE